MQNKAFILKEGKIHEEVDSLRLAIGTGTSAPLRRSGVWKFMTRSKGTDFFVTSMAIQGEMKGTIHRTRAHFGFSEPLTTAPEAWIGPLPESRHYHTLSIPELSNGEYQHVLRIGFPGFSLMKTPQPLEPGKRVVLIEPPPSNYDLSFGVTVVEGDWSQLQPERAEDEYVGLLTGDSDRYALISVLRRPYADVDAVIRNMNRNLGLINTGDRPIPDDVCVLLWMEREPHQPIKIIELNNVRRVAKSTA